MIEVTSDLHRSRVRQNAGDASRLPTTTSATTTTVGDVKGVMKGTSVKHGETGTAQPVTEQRYILRSTNSLDFAFVAEQSTYPVAGSSSKRTTEYTWTWNTGTAAPATLETKRLIVTTAQHGPNTSATSKVYFDTYGRVVWSGYGYLDYVVYDNATGAVVKHITDVNTANTSDFTGLPSGWSTPSGKWWRAMRTST